MIPGCGTSTGAEAGIRRPRSLFRMSPVKIADSAADQRPMLPGGMTRSVHHREARDDFTVLEGPRCATGAGQDIAGETRRQPIRHPPEGHPLARAAGPQVGRIVAMHREPRAGRLAEG